MNDTYTWVSPKGKGSIQYTLTGSGISVAYTNATVFEPYDTVREIQSTPPLSNRGTEMYVVFNRKVSGVHALIRVAGPSGAANVGQIAAYNRWVRSLHRALVERNLAQNVTFICGVRWNVLRWIFYAYPVVRMIALALAPIGIMGALMTGSWGFAMTCIGGGVVMLTMPTIPRPNVPKDLRRIRPYSPEAIPDGCLASER
ncbi:MULTISPECIES: hypothetical protein [Ralstonia solanacearum species complex]|uniref:hypothetical protein n=1 Tax=Ralstonia solanacearum species complex TaxID=3116862 RepID=UPI0013C2B237|nr:hypothetical protein [Ralstonia solanacearum]BEU70466.1 hypothetical protein MAFF211271_00210 [Ralstonia pseudosolanacearum]